MAKKTEIEEIVKRSDNKKKAAAAKKSKNKVKIDINKKEIKNTKKDIEQTFTEDEISFKAKEVIYRIKDGDNIRDIKKIYPMPILFNKNKIGTKTKVATGEWCKVVDIITDEKDLVFVLEPMVENS